MKFVIKNKDGKGLFSTENESCVPVEKLDSMNAAGLTFWIDGKKTSLSNTKSRFKDVKPFTVYEYEDSPVTEDDITIHTYGDPEKDFFPTTVFHRVVKGTDSSESDTVPEVSSNTVPIVQVHEPEEKKEEVIVDDFKVDLSSVGFPINSRTIVCLNNGKIYKTQTEAGKELKLDPASINTAISTNKPYKGYTFKKALEFVK